MPVVLPDLVLPAASMEPEVVKSISVPSCTRSLVGPWGRISSAFLKVRLWSIITSSSWKVTRSNATPVSVCVTAYIIYRPLIADEMADAAPAIVSTVTAPAEIVRSYTPLRRVFLQATAGSRSPSCKCSGFPKLGCHSARRTLHRILAQSGIKKRTTAAEIRATTPAPRATAAACPIMCPTAPIIIGTLAAEASPWHPRASTPATAKAPPPSASNITLGEA